MANNEGEESKTNMLKHTMKLKENMKRSISNKNAIPQEMRQKSKIKKLKSADVSKQAQTLFKFGGTQPKNNATIEENPQPDS